MKCLVSVLILFPWSADALKVSRTYLYEVTDVSFVTSSKTFTKEEQNWKAEAIKHDMHIYSQLTLQFPIRFLSGQKSHGLISSSFQQNSLLKQF